MTYSSSNAQVLKQELGARLREVRVEAGLSARALADRMGRHPSKISRIENGGATPSVTDIEQWCKHTGAGRQQVLLCGLGRRPVLEKTSRL